MCRKPPVRLEKKEDKYSPLLENIKIIINTPEFWFIVLVIIFSIIFIHLAMGEVPYRYYNYKL